MSLRQMLVGAHVLETAHNYARADDPLTSREPAAANEMAATTTENSYLYDDSFWESVLHDPTKVWRQTFNFQNITVSEWVARVPGLSWSQDAVKLRNNVEHIERKIGNYKAYSPSVKSEYVMSGVGTLRLSPDENGSALVTLSTLGDAALGIPALMSADVFEKVQRGGSIEGCVISGKASWMPMSQTWAANFPTVTKLPRGYLLLNNPDNVHSTGDKGDTQIYPFTVMQYESGASELFDYVFAGARTSDQRYRTELSNFFSQYSKEIGGRATYLFNGDMIDPIWPATHMSPAELRRNDASAPSQLSLLEARVRERQMGENKIEQILQRMGETVTDESDLKVISDEIGVPYVNWFVPGTTLAEVISQFVNASLLNNRFEALIQTLAIRIPGFVH